MREIEIDFYITLVGSGAKFLHNIPLERGLHNGISEIAGFNPWTSGGSPVDSILHPRAGIEHGEAFMMFGREGEHLHAAFLESIQPCICIEAGRVPGSIKVVVSLAIFEGHGDEGPRLGAAMPNRINSPVNPDPELHILEGFVGTCRG